MKTANLNMKLLRDWCDFCEGKANFDSFHFSTMLMGTFLDGYTEELDKFIIEITKYFDSSVYRNIKYTFGDKSHSQNDIQLLVNKDLSEKRKVLAEDEDAEDLLMTIDSQNWIFTNDIEVLYDAKASENHCLLSEILGDHVGDNIDSDKRIFALKEVLYNIASSYDLTHAILSDLIDGDVNFSNFLEIYKRGCDYAIDDETIVIYTHKE